MYTVLPTEQFEKDVKYYIKKTGFKIEKLVGINKVVEFDHFKNEAKLK